MPTPKPPVWPMSDGLHAVISKAFFRVDTHSENFGVARTGFQKTGFPVPDHGNCSSKVLWNGSCSVFFWRVFAKSSG